MQPAECFFSALNTSALTQEESHVVLLHPTPSFPNQMVLASMAKHGKVAMPVLSIFEYSNRLSRTFSN